MVTARAANNDANKSRFNITSSVLDLTSESYSTLDSGIVGCDGKHGAICRITTGLWIDFITNVCSFYISLNFIKFDVKKAEIGG